MKKFEVDTTGTLETKLICYATVDSNGEMKLYDVDSVPRFSINADVI